MVVGAYSSIFFAVPLLVSIKERFGPVAAHTKRVLAKRAGTANARIGALAAERATAASAGRRNELDELPARAGSAPRPGARPAGKRPRRRH
jgi:preprotein translocase subunit SecF